MRHCLNGTIGIMFYVGLFEHGKHCASAADEGYIDLVPKLDNEPPTGSSHHLDFPDLGMLMHPNSRVGKVGT